MTFFTEDSLRFLRDLDEHNDRDWFAANKHRYEQHIKAPAMSFIRAYEPHLHAISPHFLAVPKASGGSPPGDGAAAVGMWHPDGPALKRVRARIDADPEGWLAINDELAAAGLSWMGNSLKRAPRGYPLDHPQIDALRRKDHAVHLPLDDAQLTSPELVGQFALICRQAAPLVGWLCDAVALPF